MKPQSASPSSLLDVAHQVRFRQLPILSPALREHHHLSLHTSLTVVSLCPQEERQRLIAIIRDALFLVEDDDPSFWDDKA